MAQWAKGEMKKSQKIHMAFIIKSYLSRVDTSKSLLHNSHMNEFVIITGASSGIGKNIAQTLAAKGYRVAACMRKSADLEKLRGENLYPVILDVTNPASISQAMIDLKDHLEKSAKIHLINNAGIAIAGPVEGVSLEKWREQFEVNLFGLIATTQAALPFIRHTKGRIINISSVSGLVTAPFLGPYSASKFALEAVSDALRRELHSFGVKVVILEPGPVATPIWEKNFSQREELLKGMPEKIRALYAKKMDRFITSAKQSAKSAVPVNDVSELVFSILQKKSPKIRYVVGNNSLKYQAKIAKLMPDAWLDKLVDYQFKD